MKFYIFLVTLSLAIFLVSAFSTEEHVKRFFRPEHRALLPETTSLQLRDELALIAQNDESTKCLAHCEQECENINVEDFLRNPANFRKFELDRVATNCILASTVVFEKNPKYKCQWLELYMFDCCRACNAKYTKCIKEDGKLAGGPEFCYRKSNECVCDCQEKHNLPENKHELAP